MGDSAITIVAIFLAAILMFVFPLMTMADKTDDTAKLTVQTATTEFTDNIRLSGKITQSAYDNLIQRIEPPTKNTYEIEIVVQKLDENPAKKSADTRIGDNVYYTMYTTQVLESITPEKPLNLKEGDIVSVSVKNTNRTIASQLRNFLFKVTGNETSTITAQSSGVVTKTAN